MKKTTKPFQESQVRGSPRRHPEARSHSIRGFSLTEALVTLAIMSILMGSILTVFYQSHASYRAQTEQAKRLQQMRIAMDQIIRSVRQSGNDPFKTVGVPPVQILDEGAIQVTTDITGSVPSTTGNPAEATGDPDGRATCIYENVTIRHDPQTERIFADVGYGPEIVAEDISVLNFQFFDLNGIETLDPAQITRVRVHMVGHSELPDMQTKRIDSLTLESDVFIRNRFPHVIPTP